MAPHIHHGSDMKRQKGVAYLWMLFLVFLLGLGLGKTLDVYSAVVQRNNENELLYVGGLYMEAIRQYYTSSPGSVKKYPEKLEDLLKDRRHLTTRRYIRKLYDDPITGTPFLPLISPEGGIWGVVSASNKRPLKRSGFSEPFNSFVMAESYTDWRFIFEGG